MDNILWGGYARDLWYLFTCAITSYGVGRFAGACRPRRLPIQWMGTETRWRSTWREDSTGDFHDTMQYASRPTVKPQDWSQFTLIAGWAAIRGLVIIRFDYSMIVILDVDVRFSMLICVGNSIAMAVAIAIWLLDCLIDGGTHSWGWGRKKDGWVRRAVWGAPMSHSPRKDILTREV